MNRRGRYRLHVVQSLVLLGFAGASLPVFSQTASVPVKPSTSMVRHWTTEHGLPVNYVARLIQTSDGFIWVTSDAGLIRFDGTNFEIFDETDIPTWSTKVVWQVFETPDTTLWVISGNHELVRYRDGRFYGVEAFGHTKALYFAQARSGRLYLLTESGDLFVTTDDGGLRLLAEEMPPLHLVVDAVLEEDDCVWIATQDGLYRFAEDVQRFTTAHGLPSNKVINIVRDSKGRLLAATESGVAVEGAYGFDRFFDFSGKASEIILAQARDGQVFLIVAHRLLQLVGESFTEVMDFSDWQAGGLQFMDSAAFGGILIYINQGTRGTLAAYEHARLTLFEIDAELKVVNDIITDTEGNSWMTSDAGLVSIVTRKSENYTRKEGLPEGQAFTVLEDRDLSMWIGTWGGGLVNYADGIANVFTLSDGLADNHIRSLYQDREGTLWVGTARGLTRMRPDGAFDVVYERIGYIRAVHETSAGELLFAIGGLYKVEDGRVREYVIPGRPSDAEIWYLHEDRNNVLWVATELGIFRRKEGSWTSYSTSNGLSNNRVYNIYEDAEGHLWFSTYGGGVNRWDGESFFAYTEANGLHNSIIHAVIEDDHGYMWFTSDNGIARIARSQLDEVYHGIRESVDAKVFNEHDGLPSADLGRSQPAVVKAHDGRLWFPTHAGVAVIDPSNLAFNTVPPPVHILKVEVNGVEVQAGASTDFEPGSRNVTFQYTALSYTATENNRFRYMLDGFDTEYSEPTADRDARYTNLRPGRYTFNVIASNNDGTWNMKPAQYAFYIAPQFYESAWFISAFIFLLMASIVLLIRQARLKQKLSIEHTRQRIARDLHDDMGSKMSGIRLFLEFIRSERLLPEEEREQLTFQVESSRRLIDDLKDSVWVVDAGHDTVASLVERIGDYVRHVAPGRRISMDLPGQVVTRSVQMEWRRNVYLMFKEALHNAVKHAEAETINVFVKCTDDRFIFTVADDGRGYDPVSVARGNGLRNLHRRAADIGGKLDVETSEGAGTTVSFDGPIV